MNNLLKKIATHQVKVRLEREERKKLAAKKQTYFPLIEDHLVMMSTRKEAEKYLTKKYKLLFSNPGNQYATKELMFRAMDRLHYEVNTKLTSHSGLSDSTGRPKESMTKRKNGHCTQQQKQKPKLKS